MNLHLGKEPGLKRRYEFFYMQSMVRDATGTVVEFEKSTEIHPEDEDELQVFFSRFGESAIGFFWRLDVSSRREGWWPWAVVFLEKEYRLAGHVLNLRPQPSDYLFSAFSMVDGWAVAEKGVPSVGMLFVKNKQAIEAAAYRSEFFAKVWEQLSDLPEERNWICIPDPPSDEWLKLHEGRVDDDLFERITIRGR